ncbi:MAG: TetR/AcrR family transcriptional regulator [Thermodesulfobacteriota bacterium]
MGVQERRAREKAHRKKQILNAARKLLFERGLEGATINQIARLAELSPSALYTYYKNREEIIFVLYQEGLDLLERQVRQETMLSDPPLARLRQLARAYWSFSQEQPDYFDLITHFLTSPRPVLSGDLKRRADEQGAKILSLGRSAVEEGTSSGEFKAGDARKFILTFWAALNGVIQMKKLKETILSGLEHQSLYWYAVDGLLAMITPAAGAGRTHDRKRVNTKSRSKSEK